MYTKFQISRVSFKSSKSTGQPGERRDGTKCSEHTARIIRYSMKTAANVSVTFNCNEYSSRK